MNAPRPSNPLACVALLALVASAPTSPAPPVSFEARVAQVAGQECLIGLPNPIPAKPLAGNAPPKYPDGLRTDGVEGEVTVQFVVDTFGVADDRAFKVLNSSHAQFTTAATSALGNMQFAPAVVDGRKVKQLLQQVFYFDMAPTSGGAMRPGRATAAACSAPGPRGVWVLQPIVVYARGA